MDTAEVAKIVRANLKEQFPAYKFSVRTSRYSMGSSVSVTWTDGPTTPAVNAVIKGYERVDYDDYVGEILSGGNRFVQAHRRLSDRSRERLNAWAERRYAKAPRQSDYAWESHVYRVSERTSFSPDGSLMHVERERG